jgi:hypothetical protein
MKIAPGIHRIGDNSMINAYLIEQASEVTIIDAGVPADDPFGRTCRAPQRRPRWAGDGTAASLWVCLRALVFLDRPHVPVGVFEEAVA